MKILLSILIIASTLAWAHAETLETFELYGTLQSATGPAAADDEEVDFVYCRDVDEPIGVKESFGVFSLTFDATTRAVEFGEFSGSANRFASRNERTFLEFSVAIDGVDYPASDFVSEYDETISGSWLNSRSPAFRGTFTEKRTTRRISDNESATCTFTYELYGGFGDVGDFRELQEEPISFVNRIREMLRDYVQTLNVDEGRSNNMKMRTRDASIGVRG